MKKNKKGEWLSVKGIMSIQPMYCCSVCDDIISTYYPPNKCEKCGALNKFKGNSVSVEIEVCDELL